MGDDDIICLSSDDEFAAEQLPKKKPTLNDQVPLRAKIEPQNEQNCAAFSSKRKSYDDHESDSVPPKKSKPTSNKVIEEIIIDSPQKSVVNDLEQRIKILVSLENRDAISVARKTPLKTLDNQPKPGSSSSIVPNPRNIANRPLASKHLNNKSMTLESNDWKLATEELSMKSSQINADGSTPSVAEVVHNFFSGANNDSEIAADRNEAPSEKIPSTPKSDRPKISGRNNATEVSTAKPSRRVETPKTSRIESHSSLNAASKISGKSNDEDFGRESSRLSEIEIGRSVKTPKTTSRKNSSSSGDDHSEKLDARNIRRIESPKAGGSKISGESSKSTTEKPTRESSASSEVLIVDDTKASKTATSKTPIADGVRQNPMLYGTVEDNKSRPMPRCTRIANSPNGVTLKKPAASEATPKCPENSSDFTEITNCDISNKETPRKTSSLFNGIVNKPKMCLSRKLEADKDSSSETSSSKLQSHELPSSPKISEIAVVVKRLTPHTLESANVPNNSKSNNSGPAAVNCKNDKSSKSGSGDSSSGASKESDAKIANGLSEKKSETPKVAKVINENRSKSKDLASAVSCSKSSDVKRKISPKTDRESARVFEPKPGCSKTPDDIDNHERPQLVVKAKMPAYTCNQDTFPMFISLCLQTDRDEAMKKIVAKLKRYYDEMDPAYARSREFEELLNAKRDKISEKGKKRVYLYTSHVMDEMKRRKRRKTKETEESDKTDGTETRANALEDSAVNELNDEFGEDAEEREDDEEARRRRRTIKKIEYAMKVCAKKIQKLEDAEVGSDDDINSSYIKLDRYQVKMIELWNKMCEYTNEHADAGRAYLRPKHVRVTQIPSVDQAINSFINSRLGVNRKKSKKVTSFIDGIIFPDYVDILECIAKVNEEQNLRLDKRSQEKIAQKAFTQLGEHLQTSRRNDYWDTFSLHLENNEDPATKDAELAEKLMQNEEINRARTAEIFEEFVRKQEEARSGNRDENASDDEDDDEEEDEDEEEADKKSNDDVISDLELMEEEEDDDQNNKNNDDQIPSPQESIGEEEKEETMEIEESAIPEEDTSADQNNDTDEIIVSPTESSKNSTVQESNENEVHTVEAESDDVNKPEGEKRRLLRIRSFAKPPESWQASQEETPEDCGSTPEASKSKDIETIDVTEEDKIPSVSKSPEKNEQLKTLTIAGKTVLFKRLEKTANGGVFNTDNLPKLVMISSPVTNSTKNCSPVVVQSSNKLPTNQSPRHANLNNNTTNFGQTSKYLMIQPQSQPRLSSVSQQVRIPQLASLNLNSVQQIRIRNPTTPASGQVPRVQIRPTQQQGKFSMIQHMQIPRSQLNQLRNGQYIPAIGVPRNPEFSQLPRLRLPSANGPLVRQPIPGGSRRVQVGPVPLRGTANMQIMRLANGNLITRPVRLQQPVRISQTGTQRDGKITNSCDVSITDPATDAPDLPTLPVLRLRMNDNISTPSATTSATVQQQRPQQRVGRPGDQNWTPQSTEAPLKK